MATRKSNRADELALADEAAPGVSADLAHGDVPGVVMVEQSHPQAMQSATVTLRAHGLVADDVHVRLGFAPRYVRVVGDGVSLEWFDGQDDAQGVQRSRTGLVLDGKCFERASVLRVLAIG